MNILVVSSVELILLLEKGCSFRGLSLISHKLMKCLRSMLLCNIVMGARSSESVGVVGAVAVCVCVCVRVFVCVCVCGQRQYHPK